MSTPLPAIRSIRRKVGSLPSAPVHYTAPDMADLVSRIDAALRQRAEARS